MRRLLVAVLVAVALVGAGGPAAADPPGPTDYRSEVTDVPVEGVTASILGGDSYISLTVRGDHAVIVPGYVEGEQYLRFAPDGTVEVNRRSRARYLNEARYSVAESEVPADTGPDVPPDWVVVASGGTYAWHDHRIHWMSPELHPNVQPGLAEPQPLYDWEIPIEVDGEVTAISGSLAWVPPPGAAVTGGLGLLAVVLAAAVGLVAGTAGRVAVAVATGSVVAAVVGASQVFGQPAGATSDPTLIVLPAIALAASGAGAVVARRGAPAGLVVAALAGVPLLVFGVLQLGSLTRALVPGGLPDAGVRVAVAVVLGLGGAAVVAGVRRLLTPRLP